MYAKSVMESFWSPVNNAKKPFKLSYKKATKRLQLQIVKGHFSSKKEGFDPDCGGVLV